MSIRRIVPNIGSNQPEACRDFYVGFLGLQVGMDMGWIATYVSPSNPTAQISIAQSATAEPAASMWSIAHDLAFSLSVEVADVDHLHAKAVARGYKIVHPLTDEPWGVRRFVVTDPNGVLINIMRHNTSPETRSSTS